MTKLQEFLQAKVSAEAKVVALHLATSNVSADPKNPTRFHNLREEAEKCGLISFDYQRAWSQLRNELCGWVYPSPGPDQISMPEGALPRLVVEEIRQQQATPPQPNKVKK